jgi:hypothetical protein
MTLFDIAFFVVFVILTLLFASGIKALFGTSAWAATLMAGIVLLVLLAIEKWRVVKFRLPKCENGVCSAKDYKSLGHAKKLGVAERGFVLECRCGKRYLLRGSEFLRVDSEGKLTRYMVQKSIWSPWGEDI